jgi:hypothetical protein
MYVSAPLSVCFTAIEWQQQVAVATVIAALALAGLPGAHLSL